MDENPVICIGDICIDAYLAPLNRQFIGGSALNTAVHVHNAGVPAALIGAVGDDATGREITARLAALGVEAAGVQVGLQPTAVARLRFLSGGEHEFVHDDLPPRPVYRIDKAALERIAAARLVHNTWLSGNDVYLPAFHRLPGLRVSMDYGDHSSDDFIDRTIAHVDVAFFSLDPARRAAAQDFAAAMAARGPRLVVAMLGAQGALAYLAGESVYQPAIPAHLVDTLGAGDAFAGAFLACWLRGLPLPVVMERAAQAAARACTHLGGWENAEIG